MATSNPQAEGGVPDRDTLALLLGQQYATSTATGSILGYKDNRLVERQLVEIPQTGKAVAPVLLHTSNIGTIRVGVFSCWIVCNQAALPSDARSC